MSDWIRSLRPTAGAMTCLLTIASFRIAGLEPSWLTVAGIFFITTASMLQNDWRDRDHDAKKGKILASTHPRLFLAWLVLFWFACLALIVAVTSRNIGLGLALSGMAIAGVAYTETRRIPFLPVFLTAAVSGSCALLSVIEAGETIHVWLLFCASTLIIVAREITKDLQDDQVDPGYKWTIPVVFGRQPARTTIDVVLVLGFTVVAGASFVAVPFSCLGLIGICLVATSETSPRMIRRCLDIWTTPLLLALIIFG